MKYRTAAHASPTFGAGFRRHLGAAGWVALFVAAAGTAEAQSVWTGTTTSGTSLWSNSSNWLGGSVPASGATTSLQYFSNTTTPLPSGTITANNDLGSFTLNRLVFRGLSPATTATTTVVISGGDLAFSGVAPALTLDGQSSTGVLNYTVANNIAFNANTTLGGDGTAGLTLSGVLSGNGTLTKTGSSTVQFSGNSSSTFSGGVVIRGGALQVNGGVGGRLPASQAIAFAGGGAFTYSGNNVGASGTVGAVEFQSGLGLVQTNRGSAGNNFLTVSSFSVGQGATGRFAIGAGSNGSTTGVRIANQAVGFMGANVNFGGSGFAFYLSGSGTAGYVGNATYGTTANTAALTGNLVSLGTNSNVHIQYTPTQTGTAVASTGTSGGSMVTVTTPGAFSVGSVVAGSGVPTFTYVTAISGSTLTLSKSLTGANPSLASFSAVSTQPTATIASLALAAGNGGTVLLDTGATLTISSGGISRPGNNSTAGSVIAGGAGITTGGTNPIVYYADGANGGVSIQTPILATTTGGLIVAAQSSAPLQLAAANAFTGGVWFNGGVAEVAATETPGTSGPLGASGLIRFYGGQLRYSSANTFDYSSRFSTEAGQAVSVSTNSQNVTWATSITSASSSLTKAAAGNLTLSASNAFTSATVSGGLVRIGDANALGSGTVTLSGGGLATADATDRTIMNPIRITADPTFGVTGAGRLTLTGAVEIVPSAITVTVPGGITTELSGPISGTNTAFTLANSANANLILSGNNTSWTPASFSINNNGITVGHPNALGNGSATFTALNNSSLVVNADLTGVNARANSFVVGGVLTVSGAQGLTTTGSFTASGGDRTVTNNLPSDRLLTFGGPVFLRSSTDTAARTITFAGAGNTTISGTVANGGLSGSASILKSGTGILRLTAANTYTGTTGITAGILAIGSTTSLPGWNTAGRYSVAAGAALAVQSGVADSSVPTLLGTGNLAANAGFGFDTSDGNRTYADAAIANTSSGTLNFVKIGSGTLTMNAANTYTGTTRILEGTMRLGVANAIPASSPVVLSGNGSLDVANSTSAGTVTMTGTGSIFGAATLSGAAYVFSNADGAVTVSAILGGAASTLTKSGSGTLVLNGSSTFGGLPSMQAGTVEVTSLANATLASPLGTSGTVALGSGATVATLRYTGTGGHSTDRVINLAGSAGGGGILDASGLGTVAFLGGVTGNAGTTLTLAGSNTGANYIQSIGGSNVVKTGVGTWVFGTSSFTGQLSVQQGTIVAAVNAPGGSGTSSALGKQNGPIPVVGLANTTGTAALLAANGVTIARVIEVAALGSGSQEVVLGGSGAGEATFDANTAFRLGRGVTLAADPGGNVRFLTPTANWQQQNGSANPAVAVTIGTPTATGTVTLETTLPNSITAVTVRQGTLRLGNGGTVGALGPSGVLTGSAGATLAFDRSNTVTSGVDFAATIGGAMNVRQQGSGTVALTGLNTYTGATDVVAGTLKVDGVLGNTAVMVAAGATLTGTGTIGGPTTIQGTHSPGSSPGIETFTNGLTYEATSTLVWELIANTESPGSRGILFDGVDLTGGALSIVNGATLSLVFNLPGSTVDWSDAFWGTNRAWTIIDVAGGSWDSSLFTTLQVGVDATSATLASKRAGSSFQIVDLGGDLVLEYVVVPEPGAIALAACGLAVAWAARRRVRRRRG